MSNPAGSFIWYELMTPDPAGAARFYGAVVGWTIAAERDPASGDMDYRMIGRSSGKIFRLGDRVRVRVTNVSLDDRRVDFELAGAMETPRRPTTGRFQRQGGGRRRR